MHPLLSTRIFAPWMKHVHYYLRKTFAKISIHVYTCKFQQTKGTLMSLCMIPFLCRYSKPSSNCFVYILITCSINRPSDEIQFPTPGIYCEVQLSKFQQPLFYDSSTICLLNNIEDEFNNCKCNNAFSSAH